MTVQKVRDTITPSLQSQLQQLAEIPEKAYRYFRDITPKRSGNARRRTKLERGSREGQNVIVADYPYAQRLNDGYSKQAPQGMSEPTERYIQRLVNNIRK